MLAIACVNVASLLVAGAVTRRREFAVRMAIGASRGRLVRQSLAEAVLLALLAAFAGLLIATLGTPVLHAFVIPEAIDLTMNLPVFAAAVAVAVASGLLLGLAPALQTRGTDTNAALRDEGGAIVSGVRGSRVRLALVTVQVALSLALLVGTGLFVRTLVNVYAVPLPYDLDRMLVASLNLDARGYSPPAGLSAYEQILARVRALPGEDPLGKSILGEDNRPLLVVGVVPETVYTNPIERDAAPTVYLPLAQNYEGGVGLHVRAAGDPTLLLQTICDAIRQVDGRLARERPQRLGDILDRSLGRPRMLAALTGAFSVIGLALAVVGLYGLMAYVAAERTPEVGVRLALGARPSSIVLLLLKGGVRPIAAGLAIGLSTAAVGTRYVQAHLFGVSATDPATFAGAVLLLTVTGLVACAIPAPHVVRRDPLLALRRPRATPRGARRSDRQLQRAAQEDNWRRAPSQGGRGRRRPA